MKLSWANRLTIFRILLIVPFVSCMLKINEPGTGEPMRYIAFTIFLIMAASDGLDGYLARAYRQITTLGSFLDPVADKLLMAASYITLSIPSLGYANTLPLWLTAAVFGRDVYIVTCAFILFRKIRKKVIHVLLLGKITTVFQMGVIFLVLLFNTLGRAPAFLPWLYIITAVLTVLSGFGYTREGAKMLVTYGPTDP